MRDLSDSSRFEIASAATSREEVGNPVYPPARRKLQEHGIRCDGHSARQMTKSDYSYYDRIIGMDRANIRNILKITGGDPDHKISMLLDHTDTFDGYILDLLTVHIEYDISLQRGCRIVYMHDRL